MHVPPSALQDFAHGTWRLDRETFDRLYGHRQLGRARKFQKGELIYEQSEHDPRFYLIETGLVQVSMLREDGAEVILELMGPESVCGEGAAFDLLPRFSRAVAVRKTTAVEFDVRRLEAAFGQHPDLAAALLRVAGLKQRVLAVRLEHLTSREPEERIMDLLSRLAAMFSEPRSGGLLLKTYLTHEQIAAMTGTSRVTVTRALARLKEAQALDVIDRRILVRDLTAVSGATAGLRAGPY